MKHKLIKYGGTLCDAKEQAAIIKSVKASIKSGNWQAGEEARKMEEEAAKFLNVKYGILTNSGSSAGLLALNALELPRGSEVIIPATTFPTIFNSILQCNLVPVVVDAKVGTYNLDVNEIEGALSEKTKAIIAVHVVGNPVDMPKLMEIAKKHNLYVIEDNCDGWGSTIGGRKVGSFGDISITSFHAAHIVSMGVGGGVFTSNEEMAKRVRMYRDWGRQSDTTSKEKHGLPEDYDPRFIYEKIGYNFQILELQAAMGRVQLKKADKIKKLRKKNFNYFYRHLAKYPLTLPVWNKDADVCWFAFPITYEKRGELTAHLEKHGIETRSMFSGEITAHPAYENSPYRLGTDLPGADEILHKSFWFSTHPSLTQKDRERVVEAFDSYFNA